MAALFLSYAALDRAFALKLATSLQALGHRVWIDHWEIGVGDALWRTIEAGLADADYVIVILSPHTWRSAWVERELEVTYTEELLQRRTMLLPALIADCSLPPFLRARRFADFRRGYDIGLAELVSALDYQRVWTYSATADGWCQNQMALPSSPNTGIWYIDSMRPHVPRLSEVSVEIGLPYIGKISGVWKPDETEQAAAWELYIELVTRVAVAGLESEEGLLRESLSSLYVIFMTTRDILRKYGPSVARPKADGDVSFGSLAIQILNFVLRPVLTTWHPLLLDYEQTKAPNVSVFAHEQQWEHAAELRRVLHDTQTILRTYAAILAQVANVPQLSDP